MEERARLRSTVAAVRSQALDLLTELSHTHGGEAGHEAIARLQRVANDLGWVFAALPSGTDGPNEDPLRGMEPAPSRHAAAAMTLGYLTVPPESAPDDQAERWLRILRVHGRTGEALRRVGIRERPLATLADSPNASVGGLEADSPQRKVIETAAALAKRAGAGTTDTVHVLFAVRAVFGPSLDRVLYGHGVGWDQLTKQLVGEAELAPTS